MTKIITLENSDTVSLSGTISTTVYGYTALRKFYKNCQHRYDSRVVLNFNRLKWIDANMVAVLGGILFKLRKENKLKFEVLPGADINILKTLSNNGFLKTKRNPFKETGTAIKFKFFSPGQEDNFVKYIEKDFLDFDGIVVNNDSREVIIGAMIEIFNNYDLHSGSEYPFFVCGQYYPTKKILKFTCFDLGCGFLPPIQKKKLNIVAPAEAVLWAVKAGNSTKTDTPGGCGLSDLKEELYNNNGALEIITGNAYIRFTKKDGKEFVNPLTMDLSKFGTAINLFLHLT